MRVVEPYDFGNWQLCFFVNILKLVLVNSAMQQKQPNHVSPLSLHSAKEEILSVGVRAVFEQILYNLDVSKLNCVLHDCKWVISIFCYVF